MKKWSKDSLILQRRSGASQDPYIDITESLTINADARVILRELPSEYHGVTITGASVSWAESFEINTASQFNVDYENGFITFHPNQKNKKITVKYKGIGQSFTPATRIYTKAEGGKVLETLETIIDDATEQSELVKDILETGNVSSVNGKTGIVDGLAEQQELDNVNNTLSSQLNDIENDMKLNYLFEKIYGTLIPYSKPVAFNMSIPFPIRISASGKAEYDYDVASKKNPVSKRYYVDVNNGDNTNDGTENKPFKTLERAFRYGDADEIIMKSGIYDWSNGQAGTATTVTQKKNLNLIGKGEVYLGAHRGYRSWSSEGGGVYKTTITNVAEVIDINNYNSPKFYERKNNVEGLSEKVGTYFINGNDVYVRTISGNAPNEKVLLNMINNALQLNDFENVYMENIKFTNTFMMDNPNTKGVLSVKDCDFRFGTNDNAISIYGDVEFYFQNCKAEYGERDGFNYHVRNGKLPKGFELDCYGAFNGRDGANQNNGSTMHDGGKITRINGEYHDNQGPNVIDVNPGTQSLNIGVHSHHSTSTADLVNVDFRARDADMWLVNCVSHDSKYSTSKEGEAELHIENSLIMEPASVL